MVTRSILHSGSGGIIVDIECHLSNGLPNIIIVGFANRAIDEAKERIRSAFASAKLSLPRKRITINLAPADIPKESTGFDLAIATAILAASGQTTRQLPAKEAIIGELGLDGKVRPVRGIIGKLVGGRDKGITTFYIPADNLRQALLVPGITVVAISNIKDLYLDLNGQASLERKDTKSGTHAVTPAQSHSFTAFSDIVGQTHAKRALEIVAAGGHNILLNGPPGTGKSMLAKALHAILPPLTHEEMLEVTQLHSLATNNYEQIITERPFRAPHHSASHISIIGGGQRIRPGEISLSHCGILFFDELPEYPRSSIEALRQPLEDQVISITRASDNIVYPANFTFIATCNPCPCGHFNTTKPCVCLPHQIVQYQQKLSGPILDRIDLYADVQEIDHANLLSPTETPEKDILIARKIIRARHLQTERYKSGKKLNAHLTNRELKAHSQLTPEAKIILDQAATRLSISARSYMRTVKVARTIADLEASATIRPSHITEALQYRRPNHKPI